MQEKWILLLFVIETMAIAGIIGTWVSKDTRVSFLFGFNVLLPVTFLHVLYSDGDPARHTLLLAMVGIYQIRMNFILILWYRNTAAAKLKDILPPAEIYLLPVLLTNVAGWIYCLPFVWTVDRPGPLDRLDLIVVCVYVLGTIFHFGSDFQKHRFKQRPDSYGRGLDTGFWGISRHPNYFGDFLIYIAFGLSAGNFWGFISPLANLAQYLGDAIPKSEKMSSERYGKAWEDYTQRTKSLIPYIL